MTNSPTVGASYSSTPLGLEGTRLSSSSVVSQLSQWKDLVAVVLPMCNGKSTCAEKFGGYDIDDVVVNTGELKCDAEYRSMIDLREAGLWDQSTHAMHIHNGVLLKRARQFFQHVSPDANAKILYVHTAELAHALGIPIVFAGGVDSIAIANCARLKQADAETAAMTVRVAREQLSANMVFCRRHSIEHKSCESYTTLMSRIENALVLTGHYRQSDELQALRATTGHLVKDSGKLDAAMRVLKRKHGLLSVKAIAARAVIRSLGAMAPQEAQYYHNHAGWAKVVHAVCQVKRTSVAPDVVRSWTEDDWKEKFPYGPGNAAFALCKISHWLEATPDEELANYDWFLQSCSVADLRYERLLCMALYSDMLIRDSRSGGDLLFPISKQLQLGCLNTADFMEVTQYMHNITRVSCSYFGRGVHVSLLPKITYLHCLSGRNFGMVDMDKEVADRTGIRTPKWFFVNGRRSESEFDKRFTAAVRESYDYMGVKTLESMLNVFKDYPDFDTFLENRKKWVRAGSASGGPKTDVKLLVPQSRMHALEEVTQDVIECGFRVINKIRLNKAAVFEFKELPDIVRAALGNYVPNSFTRHFTKHEVGKPEGRALYPSHMLHYIVVSFLLTVAEKGAPIPGTRLLSSPDQQADDHMLWRTTREFCVGLMLDYANFNEQHEIKHMKVVIEELRGFFSKYHHMSPDVDWAINWVCESMDRIVFEHGEDSVYFLHGLLSGWRCTTWNNSVINRANKRVIAQQVREVTGLTVLTEFQSGGDDVAADTRSYHDAAVILRVGEAMGFEFKAIKQLVSSHYVEFYRLFVAAEGVFGSLCRMIGSACSGQWSNSVIAKFVEPAAKLNSIVEIARKAGRRSLFDMTYAEKITACSFRKWATYDEIKLTEELIHGTVRTGGLGVPTVMGEVYELAPMQADDDDDVEVELVGIPNDASMQVAEQVCAEVAALMGSPCAEDPVRLANEMSSAVFMGAIGSSEGARVLQKLKRKDRYGKRPVVLKHKNVLREQFSSERANRYMRDKAANAQLIEDYRRTKRRYASLSKACKKEFRYTLALKVTDGTRVDARKLMLWCDELTLYGCATYMLTEDYYETVVILSLHSSDGSEDDIAWHAGRYATGLANDGYLYY